MSLASSDLGRGDLLYFAERLPSWLATWQEALYHHLAPIAISRIRGGERLGLELSLHDAP